MELWRGPKLDSDPNIVASALPDCPEVRPSTLDELNQSTISCMVGAVGIEPTTFGLKGRCSTTELRPYVFLTSYIEMT